MNPPVLVRSLALRLPGGHRIEAHRHAWGQIVYATEGVLTVDTREGAWVVPSLRAVWVPAETMHGVRTTGRVWMRTVYLHPSLTRTLPASGRVLSVSPLLRELVREVIRVGMLREDVPDQRRLARVLIDQLLMTPEAPLELTWPMDPRARRVAEAVNADLESTESLTSLAPGVGASTRTLERLFLKETGLTFRRWRQRARILEALRCLAAGESVTATALAVGFSSSSAFITMFRRCLGTTPGNYFRAP